MNIQKQTKGFTIIEVVLVLAIAALIFLMIFVALPALQRGQRDTARKEDVGTLAAAVNTYRSNHSGTLPEDWADLNPYIDKLSQLDTEQISITDGDGQGPSQLDHAIIYTSAKCNNNNVAVDGSSRQAAVVVVLEAGNSNVKYCQGV